MDLQHLSKRLTGLAAAVVLAIAAPAVAAPISDPANDYLTATYTGAHSPDLDVLSVFAVYDGANFHIGGTMAGPIQPLATHLFVYGVNRGAGVATFGPTLGLNGVLFDAVITLNGLGVTGGTFALPAGSAHINGASFQIDIPAALLPSTGFTPAQYGFNLWPRDTTQLNVAAISDFAPDNSTFVASAPEPMTLALLGSGLAALGFVRRRHAA